MWGVDEALSPPISGGADQAFCFVRFGSLLHAVHPKMKPSQARGELVCIHTKATTS
jgi:hypothetical protein